MTNKFLNNVYQGNNNWKSYVATITFGYLAFFVLKLLLVYLEPVLRPIEAFSMPLYEVLTMIHIIALLLLIVSVKTFHKRSTISLINTSEEYDSNGNKISWYERIRWRLYFKGFILWTIAMVICLIIGLLISGKPLTITNFFSSNILNLRNFVDIGSIIVLLLIAVPLQTAYEEILCRGYINQALSLKIKNPIFIILISTIIFTSSHFLSPDYQANLASFLFAFIIGIFLSFSDFYG